MRRLLTTIALVIFVTTPGFAQTKPGDHWVATWTTALVARPAMLPPPAPNAPPVNPPPITPDNETLRQIVRASMGGSRVRVVFANTFGTAPLTIGSAAIARTRRIGTLCRPRCAS